MKLRYSPTCREHALFIQNRAHEIEYHKSENFVTRQVKAWMNESLMLCWAKEVLLKHTKGKHCLLLLDSFHAHITEKVTKFLQKSNVSTAVIPRGCTSKVQPLDVCINNPIKDTIRGEWEAFLMETIDKAGDNEGASKTDIAKWIHTANSVLHGFSEEISLQSMQGLRDLQRFRWI